MDGERDRAMVTVSPGEAEGVYGADVGYRGDGKEGRGLAKGRSVVGHCGPDL